MLLLLLKTDETITCPLTLSLRGADAAITAAAVSDRVVPREAMLDPSPDRFAITCAMKMARLKSISPTTRMSIMIADKANSTSAWPDSLALFVLCTTLSWPDTADRSEE